MTEDRLERGKKGLSTVLVVVTVVGTILGLTTDSGTIWRWIWPEPEPELSGDRLEQGLRQYLENRK